MRPATVVPGRGTVRVVGLQYRQDPTRYTTYDSVTADLECYFHRYVDADSDPSVPTVAVFNELTSIGFGVVGSRGAAARAFSATPAATAGGQRTGEPLGALGGAIGLVAAAYTRETAYYAARFPAAYAADTATSVATVAGGGIRIPADLAFLALTDTYVRAAVDGFAQLARTHHVAVVAGAILPVLDDATSCTAAGYPGWVACPGWRASTDPVDVAAVADPDLAVQYATGTLRSVYVATTPSVENVALFFDARGRLYDMQSKVNLTPIELQLGWRQAPPSTIHAVTLRDRSGRAVAGVSMGVAISLDAFEHADRPDPCGDRRSYMACLDSKGVNLLLQPEFNDGVAECSSWSDFSPACGSPAWQQLGWMLSSWYDVEARDASGAYLYPHLRDAVNPFMVGNLYDITGDGQSAIVARDDPRAQPGWYAGDRLASLYAAAGRFAPYADPTAVDPTSSPRDPVSLAQLDGAQPGFLAVVPWVVSDGGTGTDVRDDPSLAPGDPRSLESCEDGLVPGSGVTSGPCAENAYVVGAVVAELSP